MAKKSFNEKLNSTRPAEVISVNPEFAGGEKMLVATPIEYDAIMKTVPHGKVITSDIINRHLAKKHNADWTCPLTAGIFINIAANASEERKGKNETPYWRTVKKSGELNEKYPSGCDGHKTLLEIEGHTVIKKGKRYFLSDYESKLFNLEEQ